MASGKTTLKVYPIRVRILEGGGYVEPDPCAGGGYNRDAYHTHFITCTSVKRAREIAKLRYPDGKITVLPGAEV